MSAQGTLQQRQLTIPEAYKHYVSIRRIATILIIFVLIWFALPYPFPWKETVSESGEALSSTSQAGFSVTLVKDIAREGLIRKRGAWDNHPVLSIILFLIFNGQICTFAVALVLLCRKEYPSITQIRIAPLLCFFVSAVTWTTFWGYEKFAWYFAAFALACMHLATVTNVSGISKKFMESTSASASPPDSANAPREFGPYRSKQRLHATTAGRAGTSSPNFRKPTTDATSRRGVAGEKTDHQVKRVDALRGKYHDDFFEAGLVCPNCAKKIVVLIPPEPIRGERAQIFGEATCSDCRSTLYTMTLPGGKAFIGTGYHTVPTGIGLENAMEFQFTGVFDGRPTAEYEYLTVTPLVGGPGPNGMPKLFRPEELE